MNRRCYVCKIIKDLGYFYNDKYQHLGHQYICKKCHNEKSKTINKRLIRIEGSYIFYRSRYRHLQMNAKKRGIDFQWSYLDYKNLYITSNKRCYYCNTDVHSFPKIHTNSLTIDRKDNTVGYVKGNCVVACFRCNTMKSHKIPSEEMLKLGKIIRGLDKIGSPTGIKYIVKVLNK